MYTALLQNQVLGIDNPYLLHEIHNRDENYMKEDLYSQMQRQINPEEIELQQSLARKSALFSGMPDMTDSSPFNSKFTVLKFNNAASSSAKFGNQILGSEPHSMLQRGLFSNRANQSAHQYLPLSFSEMCS